MYRVVLDTCVVVAAVKSRTGASFVLVDTAALNNEYFETIVSTPLLSEYDDVLGRPEHRNPNWSQRDLWDFVGALAAPGYWARPSFSYRPQLDDPGDELVLEAAINGQADYIVTFNGKHFRPAACFGIRVTTPGHFLQILQSKGFSHGKK